MAVTQQLAISFWYCRSASILGYFDTENVGTMVDNFHLYFITVGIITLLSSFVFLLLDKHDGDNLIIKKKKKPNSFIQLKKRAYALFFYI